MENIKKLLNSVEIRWCIEAMREKNANKKVLLAKFEKLIKRREKLNRIRER